MLSVTKAKSFSDLMPDSSSELPLG